MLIASISVLFALVSGNFARINIPKGWQLLSIGWLAIQTNASKEDASTDIERQRGISDGAQFFLAGLGWLIAGIGAAILTLVFIALIIYFGFLQESRLVIGS